MYRRHTTAVRSRSKRIRKLIRHLAAGVIVVGFMLYLWEHRSDLAPVWGAAIWQIASIALLVVIGWVAGAAQTKVLYRAIDVNLTLGEAVQLAAAGGFGNYLPIRAGVIIRAYYLKDVHRLHYARFGGVALLRILLNLIAAGVAGLACITFMSLMEHRSDILVLLLIFLALILTPFLLLIVPFTLSVRIPFRFHHVVLDSMDAFNATRRRPAVALSVITLILVQQVLLGLRFVISAQAIDVHVDPAVLFLMSPLATLMQFVAITPGAIGLREAVMGYVSHTSGLTFADGILVGAVDRAVLLAVTATLGGLCFRIIWRKISHKRKLDNKLSHKDD